MPVRCVAMTDLNLAGELDLETIVAARRGVYELIDERPGQVVTIGLHQLTFIDSTGLGLLVGALKKARLGGGDVNFTRPRDELWRTFTVTGLDRALTFVDA